jgi:hypothetical protein
MLSHTRVFFFLQLKEARLLAFAAGKSASETRTNALTKKGKGKSTKNKVAITWELTTASRALKGGPAVEEL